MSPTSADRVARDLMDHAPLVAFSVGPDLRVGPGGASRLAGELLGGEGDLAGEAFAPLVLPGSDKAPDRTLLEDWLRLVFEQPDQDWETVAELCPLEELEIESPGGEKRVFRTSFHPMRAGEGGPVVRVLVVGTDVSSERRLARELQSRDAEGEASVRRFAEVLKLGAETFRRFLNESQTRLAEAAGAADRLASRPDDREAARTLFRQMHTLRANARAFRLSWLADAAGAVEDGLAELRDAEVPGEHPALDGVLERLETMRVLYDETEELGVAVFGRSLDPGEARHRYRDLEVPVRVGRLESALALVRGATARLSGGEPDAGAAKTLLDRIGESLDALRRVPARHVFQRFPKMVADLAAIAGKRVAPLKVSGSDTLVNVRALDRSGDAFVHMLRNAVVHGIERAEDRLAAGKPEAGTVELTLAREGDSLVFEVADDGAGIDREQLRAGAVAAGVISEEEAAGLSPEEADKLVLRPGLSTSSGAGADAGRGVGLDSVVAAAEFLDGSVEIDNRPGEGFRVRLVVPDRGPC
ncbi:MAG: ATP-binding protein [Planctomycetota bacterium]